MNAYLHKTTSAAPLAIFRVALGLLLFAGIVRFWMKGWISELYINPTYFFPFYGFEFVRPLGDYTYGIFLSCGVCALLVAIGLFYRVAIIGLFLSFTYIELMDKSTYLNHYYFISMVCMLMIFLPANTVFSMDSRRRKHLRHSRIPAWCIDSVKLLVALLYVFAGLAKLNSDWLLDAMPLRIWLPAKNETPLIGSLLNYEWVAYAFSWFGCLYDLTIAFFLLNRRTQPFAYATVVIFHILTSILFPIGMFPFIMIATATIFFPPEVHEKIIVRISQALRIPSADFNLKSSYQLGKIQQRVTAIFLILFFSFNTLTPMRYLLYPGELFWTEEGYRFSWRVMLMEKAGYAQFKVKDKSGKIVMVNNAEFLTPLQEKMMSTQPDMILQYAHILRDHYSKAGLVEPEVYVDSYVTLNGRLSQAYIDPEVDLAKQKESFDHKSWILPFKNEISGF